MEMSGGSGNGAQYSAIAFSLDAMMSNADVYFCSGNEVVSGAIGALRNPPSVDSNLPVRF